MYQRHFNLIDFQINLLEYPSHLLFRYFKLGVIQEIIYPNFRKYFEPRQGTINGV